MRLTSKLKVALKSLFSVSLSEIETDKAVLIYDGDLAEGTEVFVKDEEAEDGVKAAEDGAYETDTQIIEVEDGKIAKITEKESKDGEEIEIEAKRAKFVKVKAAYEESYEDKERKIQEAIVAKGFDAYLIEAGEDYAVAEIWSENGGNWTDYRFDVSWDEDGNAIVGDPIEVVSKFVPAEEEETGETLDIQIEQAEDGEEPADEPDNTGETASIEDRLSALETLQGEIKNALEQLLNSLSSLEGRIEDLEAKVAKLDDTPADEPADEEVEIEEGERSKVYYLRKQNRK